MPLTMVPLEVTHTALAAPEVLGRMFSRGGPGSISPFKVGSTGGMVAAVLKRTASRAVPA